MKTKLRTFIIDRANWVRGGKNGESALLNRQGAMRCLGFLSKSAGISKCKLLGRSEPMSLVQDEDAPSLNSVYSKIKGLLRKDGKNTKLASRLMGVNDSRITWHDESDREKEITRLLAKIGWRPRFIH